MLLMLILQLQLLFIMKEYGVVLLSIIFLLQKHHFMVMMQQFLLNLICMEVVQILKKTRLRQKMQEVLSVAMNFQKQGKFYQSDLGLYYYKDPLIFGLWYRGIPFVTSQAGDAIIGLIGIKTKSASYWLQLRFYNFKSYKFNMQVLMRFHWFMNSIIFHSEHSENGSEQFHVLNSNLIIAFNIIPLSFRTDA